MRKVKVTDKNEDTFAWSDDHSAEMLEVFDELLHARGLELVIGDNGCSDYQLRIDPVQEDGEYDHENTHKVLYGR